MYNGSGGRMPFTPALFGPWLLEGDIGEEWNSLFE